MGENNNKAGETTVHTRARRYLEGIVEEPVQIVSYINGLAKSFPGSTAFGLKLYTKPHETQLVVLRDLKAEEARQAEHALSFYIQRDAQKNPAIKYVYFPPSHIERKLGIPDSIKELSKDSLLYFVGYFDVPMSLRPSVCIDGGLGGLELARQLDEAGVRLQSSSDSIKFKGYLKTGDYGTNVDQFGELIQLAIHGLSERHPNLGINISSEGGSMTFKLDRERNSPIIYEAIIDGAISVPEDKINRENLVLKHLKAILKYPECVVKGISELGMTILPIHQTYSQLQEGLSQNTGEITNIAEIETQLNGHSDSPAKFRRIITRGEEFREVMKYALEELSPSYPDLKVRLSSAGGDITFVVNPADAQKGSQAEVSGAIFTESVESAKTKEPVNLMYGQVKKIFKKGPCEVRGIPEKGLTVIPVMQNPSVFLLNLCRSIMTDETCQSK